MQNGIQDVEVNTTQAHEKKEKEKVEVKWTTIKVPDGLRKKLKEMATMKDKAIWEVVAEGVECLQRESHKNWARRNTSELDRISYYIMKLMTSVERFKMNTNDENLAWLENTVMQITKRLGVDITYLINIARRYYKTRDKDDYVELNMLAKLAISDIITKKLLSEN